ncbi:MotA/TolQ/ExbB proton channel family protein, partial [Acidithiobacillus ferridurans]|nr:MotA/TolQ/ExbB proton channel family protein [Acidithiobacillus ferridurans]
GRVDALVLSLEKEALKLVNQIAAGAEK